MRILTQPAVAVILLYEQIRSRHSESVYALLNIADHECVVDILTVSRHTCQNVFLQKVTVLILIYKYLPVPP